MVLYHGSPKKFDEFDLQYAQVGKDFGKGIYFTSNPQQAIQWARRFANRGYPGYLYKIEIPRQILTDFLHYRIKTLTKYNKEWLEFVIDCRIDLEEPPYDIVYDKMADNRYPELVMAMEKYHDGELSLMRTLSMIQSHDKYADQYCFKSKAALGTIHSKECLALGGPI